MKEVEISGNTYRIGKIDARRQWHVVRRIAPALVGVISLVDAQDDDAVGLINKIEPFLSALAKMSDDDSDYVLEICLSVVQRKIDGDRGWSSVGTPSSLMFEDIDLAGMMRIAFEAGSENLAGFFAAIKSMFPTHEALMAAAPLSS